MGLIIAAVGGAVIFYFIAAARRSNHERHALELMKAAYVSPSPEARIDEIIASRRLQVVDAESNDASFKAVAVAQFITEQAVSWDGKELSKLDEDEAFIAMLICMIACGYFSRQLGIQFETISAGACISLM